MAWAQYAVALLLFNVLGALVVYGLQRLQFFLPLNPQKLTAVTPDSSFNTAVSFVTNTNWQGYSGESTMGYLVQMAGLAVQNFLSAATGIAVAIALIRGFARHSADHRQFLGRCHARDSLYPAAARPPCSRSRLSSQGVIQNFDGYKDATTIEKLTYHNPKTDAAGNPVKDAAGNPVTETATTQTQTLPMGPVASQESIKELGTNGGGFFNANSAHPYENPTALTNLLEMLAILLIPFALTYTFGKMVGDTRQGWAVLAAMLILLVPLVGHRVPQRTARQSAHRAGRASTRSRAALQPGGNMEGKETRFGIAASALFAAVTTATSCGAVNTMHDSMTPLGGFVPLFLMQLGELAPGGVGTGLYTMLIFAILGVFIAGLMIGRTPEYLGKKIEAIEMKLASIFILDDAVCRADRHGGRRHDDGRQGRRRESRSTRLQRNSVCLHLRRQQQRQRVWRTVGEHRLLQRGARPCHVDRSLLADRRGTRHRRIAGGEEARPGHRRHDADARPLVRGAADRLDSVDRRSDLRPGARARPGRRALHARRSSVRNIHMSRQQLSLFDRKLIGPALLESFRKLDPRVQWRNPVMFVVYIGTIVTAVLYVQALGGHGEASPGFILAITVWLVFTVLFANFAEALAEGRSRAQASALRDMRQTVLAKKFLDPTSRAARHDARQGGGPAQGRRGAGRNR